MTSVPSDTPASKTSSAADSIAGLLSAFALFLALFQIAYRPFRLAPAALILLLISVLMSRRHTRLNLIALAAIGIGFVLGAALQVWTNHPMF